MALLCTSIQDFLPCWVVFKSSTIVTGPMSHAPLGSALNAIRTDLTNSEKSLLAFSLLSRLGRLSRAGTHSVTASIKKG